MDEKINLYAGAGLTYDLFEEKNPAGKVRENKLGGPVKIEEFIKAKYNDIK